MTAPEKRITSAELRRAADAIAHDRHPDQAGCCSSSAFVSPYGFAEVRMTGGSVLVSREEAEVRVREDRARRLAADPLGAPAEDMS